MGAVAQGVAQRLQDQVALHVVHRAADQPGDAAGRARRGAAGGGGEFDGVRPDLGAG